MWQEYKEIVKSNTAILRESKWWKPAIYTAIIAIMLNIVSLIWIGIKQSQLNKYEAELDEMEEELR